MKKIWKKEDGVSPVIAVILMVAITVVLAAVLYVMVSGMLGGGGTTPRITMRWDKKSGEPGNYTGKVLEISGGDPPELKDVSVSVVHGGSSNTDTLDNIASNDLTVGTLTLTFSDGNNDNELGGQDTWIITGGESGDTITLVYEPTNGQMGEEDLP